MPHSRQAASPRLVPTYETLFQIMKLARRLFYTQTGRESRVMRRPGCGIRALRRRSKEHRMAEGLRTAAGSIPGLQRLAARFSRPSNREFRSQVGKPRQMIRDRHRTGAENGMPALERKRTLQKTEPCLGVQRPRRARKRGFAAIAHAAQSDGLRGRSSLALKERRATNRGPARQRRAGRRTCGRRRRSRSWSPRRH